MNDDEEFECYDDDSKIRNRRRLLDEKTGECLEDLTRFANHTGECLEELINAYARLMLVQSLSFIVLAVLFVFTMAGRC